MDAERWQRLSPQLDVLLELAPAARAARLQTLREQDTELAAALEELLALEQDDTSFIDRPLLAPDSATAEEDSASALAGTCIGPYRMLRSLGEGGMGMVWQAERADGLYQRRVALKLLHAGLAHPDLRARFDREREILARLAHPNIARLLDAGIAGDDRPYLALEFVEGEAITDYCQHHALPLDARLALFLQVCEAVSHAHANLVVHRDLKPSNILVDERGQVRLLDFGIAKLLDTAESASTHPRTEVRAFTLHYAAPEQIGGGAITTRTDVYSLGVVLYELLTDRKPYRLRRASDAEWEQAILAAEPLKPSQALLRGEGDDMPRDGGAHDSESRRRARALRGDLDNIALKALAKAPEQRYPSVEALALDLQRYRQGRPVTARPPSVGYRLHKYGQRHRWTLAAGVAAAALLLGAASASLWQARQATREAARAQAMQGFVIGLFDHADVHQDGTVHDIRKLLEAGELRGERELAGQPLAHAELLGIIARLRTSLGDYNQALALLHRQQTLLQSLGEDARPELRLQATTQYGRVLRLLGRSRECVQAMAASGLPGAVLGHRWARQESEFLSEYGHCRRLQGEGTLARSLFERSLQLRRSNHDEAGVAGSLYDLALLDADLERNDAAVQGYRQALLHLRAHVGDQHPLEVEILRNLGSVYRNRGDTDAALQTYDQALRVARQVHGERHPLTLTLRRQQLAVQVDLGHYAQAEREVAELQRLTEQALGPRHRESGLIWNTLGIIAWERGDLDRAIEDVARAVDIWRGPDGASQLAGGLFNYGMVLHAAGRDDEALAALQEARRLRAAQYGASHARVGNIDRMIGEVIAATDPARAQPWLQRGLQLLRIGYGESDPRTRFAELALARNQARLDADPQALARLDALAALDGSGSEFPKLRWRARAYAAEARCGQGERTPALTALEQLQDELTQAQPDGGSIPREVAAIRTACLRTAPERLAHARGL